MIEPGLHRDLGRMEGKMAAMDAELKGLRTEIRKANDALVRIDKMLAAAGGGWKALVIAGTVGGAITAFFLNVKRLLGLQ